MLMRADMGALPSGCGRARVMYIRTGGIPCSSLEEHKSVVDRFGRFPHRNHLFGRENTAEEQVWLDDYEALPRWAKSQLPQPTGK